MVLGLRQLPLPDKQTLLPVRLIIMTTTILTMTRTTTMVLLRPPAHQVLPSLLPEAPPLPPKSPPKSLCAISLTSAYRSSFRGERSRAGSRCTAADISGILGTGIFGR